MNPRTAFEFRASTCDANVFHDVVIGNEYRLPDALDPEALVVDVGCHIGSFTQACLERGARRIVAFEPDLENFSRARRHLHAAIAAGHVTLLPAALTGSQRGLAHLAGYLVTAGEVNTGGGALAAGRVNVVRVGLADLQPVWHGAIGLLKLDCEGSEWGILDALRRTWPRPAAVCGEYHPQELMGVETLRLLLQTCGYTEPTIEPHGDSGLGLFWGKL